MCVRRMIPLVESQRGELADQTSRHRVAGYFALGEVGRRELVGQVPPALVRALGLGVDEDQLAAKPDRPAGVGALLEAEDLAPRDDRVLHDPIERAADHLRVPFGQVASGHQGFVVALDPFPQVLEGLRGVGDLGHVERHEIVDRSVGLPRKAIGYARPVRTASPRNEKKPITSVAVVTNTADETAGSMRKRSSVTGTMIPAMPAVRLLITIAEAITAPSRGLWNSSPVPVPIRMASEMPLASAMRNSRQIIRTVFELVSWLVAKARTTTASVWVPALPPMPDTIGMSTASSASLAIAPWNTPTTDDAMIAVPRLITSHDRRARTVRANGSLMSPSPAPDRRRMSSPASSEMMWTMSSTVSWPTRRPLSSTTAALIRAYFWKRSATSSWSIDTGMRVWSRFITSASATSRGE